MNNSFMANQDPFPVKGNSIQFPWGEEAPIGLDRQVPYVKQFNLSIPNDAESLSDMFKKAFSKKVLIWHMEQAWGQDGNLRVVLFYSEITPPVDKTLVPKTEKEIDASLKIPEDFDAFVEEMASKISGMEIIVEDDDDSGENK